MSVAMMESPPAAVEGQAAEPGAALPDAPIAQPITNRKHTINSLFFSVQPLILSGAMLPATAYVIHSLGPTAYGQWTTAASLIAVANVLTNLGLRGPFVRSVAANPETGGSALADQLGIRLVLAVLSGVVAIAACVAGCMFAGWPPVVLFCTIIGAVGLIFGTINATAFDLLQGLQRLSMVAIFTMISGVILTGTSVLVVWRGGGPIGVAVAYLLGPTVAAALSLYVIHKKYPVTISWHPGRSARLLWNARFFAAQQLVNTASDKVTGITVASLLGQTAMGYFAAGSLLADRLSMLPDGLGNAAYSTMARASQRGARAVVEVLNHYLLLAVLVCLPATLLITLLAGPIARLLFPHQPEVCQDVIRITVWLLPLAGIECILGYSLNALHKDAAQARASLFSAIHLLFAGFLVWKFGLIGASWAMVLRSVVRLAVIMPCVVRTFGPLIRESRRTKSTIVTEVTA